MTRAASLLIGLIAAIAVAINPAPSAAEQRARPSNEMVMHPAALAKLIDEVAGRRVTLPKARVVAVINPRAMLVESASALPAHTGSYDRVLVLIDAAALHVRAQEILETNVKIIGTARTLLGLQTTAEVPWPQELTKEAVKRYEVRAAVLASSVQTADGVELTERQ